MNNDQIKALALDLYNANDEDRIENILKKVNLWDDSNWDFLGGRGITASSIQGTQQDNPIGALVEKIVNSIDAVLTKECLSRGVDPTSKEAPKNIKQAQIDYFQIYDGHLTNVGFERRKEIAQNIHLVASGYKSNPSLSIIDRGEGQEPDNFQNSLLSLVRGIKQKVMFVQGKHGMGGTGVISYCSKNHRFQLIISKRNNQIPNRKSDEWGLTIIRKFKPGTDEKSSSIRYLAPNGKVLSFKAEGLNVIPQQENDKYVFKPLDSGTIVKLYEYNLGSERNPGRARERIFRYLQDRLSTLLPASALPFIVSDLRYPEKKENSQRLFNPLNVRIDENRNNLIEYESSATIMHDGQKFDCRTLLFKYDSAKSSDQGKRTYARAFEGILFTFNGQTQGVIDETFFTEIGYKDLKESLLLIVDCSNISTDMQEDIFMTSRDRLRKSENVRIILEQKLVPMLKDDHVLKEARQRRIREKNEHLVNNSQNLVSVLQKIINANPTLTSLFLKGDKISSPLDHRQGGLIDTPYEGKEFPSFFSLKENFNQEHPREVQMKRKIRIIYETDAENNYFFRDKDAGVCELYINDEPASFDSFNLINGIAVLNLKIDEIFKVGEIYKLTTKVSDISRVEPFEETMWVKIIDYVDSKGGESKPRPPSPDDKKDGERKMSDKFAPPQLVWVSSSDWHLKSMNGKSALQADYAGSDIGWTFSINIDNDFLLHYAKNNKRKNLEILRKKYSLALTLMGISLIHNTLNEDATNNGEVSDQIASLSENISMVLLPIIDDLGKEDSSMIEDIEFTILSSEEDSDNE